MGFVLLWFVFLLIVSQGIGALMHYYNYGKIEIVIGYNKQWVLGTCFCPFSSCFYVVSSNIIFIIFKIKSQLNINTSVMRNCFK